MSHIPNDGNPVSVSLRLPNTYTPPFKDTTPSFTSFNTRWKFTDINSETKCLADNIYFEGRNQSLKGQLAIGLATLNRVKSKHFPDSICEVVWQQNYSKKTGKEVAQFSWTLDGKSDVIANKEVYDKIHLIAESLIAEGTLDNVDDFTEGATHYHADYVNPYWQKSMQMVAQIDDHLFYKN